MPQVVPPFKETMETVVTGALYTTGGIAVTLNKLHFVQSAIVSKSDVGPYEPFVKTSGGTLLVGFGTIATANGQFVELATAVGSVVATVTVHAWGY